MGVAGPGNSPPVGVAAESIIPGPRAVYCGDIYTPRGDIAPHITHTIYVQLTWRLTHYDIHSVDCLDISVFRQPCNNHSAYIP